MDYSKENKVCEDLRHSRAQYFLPERPWMTYQEWHQVLLLHWCLPPCKVAPFIPRGLQPDLYDGWAWISIVVFQGRDLHPRGLPAFPVLSDFLELNLRTYVREGTTGGILFLDIETNKGLLASLMRLFSGLPYHKALLRHEDDHLQQHYRCRNARTGVNLDLCFNPGPQLTAPTSLDRWLTERYCSYHTAGRRLYELPICHREWPLQSVGLQTAEIDVHCLGQRLGTGNLMLAHFAQEQRVLAWNRHRVLPASSAQPALPAGYWRGIPSRTS